MWGALVETSPMEDLAEESKSRESNGELLTANHSPTPKGGSELSPRPRKAGPTQSRVLELHTKGETRIQSEAKGFAA